MDRKFVFLLVVAVISISAKVNQKKKCREMCESNKYCKSWKYNEKTNKCKITIKKGDRRPRTSVPCETATKCEKMYESNVYCESWKFDEKSKRCTMFFNQDPFDFKTGCTGDVVQNRCNATGIPPEVQPACRIIGKGLIQQYECSHETGELTDPKKMTCCRDVVLNLCTGSPEKVGDMTIRQDCIQDGYNDCFENNCSVDCVSKVLFELCGYRFSSFICALRALEIANDLAEKNGTFGYCNGTDIARATCTKAVNQLCEAAVITEPNVFCMRLGQRLCDTN